jgi:hypothetical protein
LVLLEYPTAPTLIHVTHHHSQQHIRYCVTEFK